MMRSSNGDSGDNNGNGGNGNRSSKGEQQLPPLTPLALSAADYFDIESSVEVMSLGDENRDQEEEDQDNGGDLGEEEGGDANAGDFDLSSPYHRQRNVNYHRQKKSRNEQESDDYEEESDDESLFHDMSPDKTPPSSAHSYLTMASPPEEVNESLLNDTCTEDEASATSSPRRSYLTMAAANGDADDCVTDSLLNDLSLLGDDRSVSSMPRSALHSATFSPSCPSSTVSGNSNGGVNGSLILAPHSLLGGGVVSDDDDDDDDHSNDDSPLFLRPIVSPLAGVESACTGATATATSSVSFFSPNLVRAASLSQAVPSQLDSNNNNANKDEDINNNANDTSTAAVAPPEDPPTCTTAAAVSSSLNVNSEPPVRERTRHMLYPTSVPVRDNRRSMIPNTNDDTSTAAVAPPEDPPTTTVAARAAAAVVSSSRNMDRAVNTKTNANDSKLPPARDKTRSSNIIPHTEPPPVRNNSNSTANNMIPNPTSEQPPVRDSTRIIKKAYRRMKKKKKKQQKEQAQAPQEEQQEEDEGKRCGIKDLLCKTTHEELLKPYEFVGNPSIPPIAPPKPAGGFKKDGTPETETPSDENRSPDSSYEQARSSEEDDLDDLESGLIATTDKGAPEILEELHYVHSAHKIGRNLMSKFSRASSSHEKKTQQNYHPNYHLEDGISGSMMYATTIVGAVSVDHHHGLQSATMLTAGLSEDDTDIYAKKLDTSDEYDEGYEGGNDRSFDELFYQQTGTAKDENEDDDDEHSNVVPMMICTKFMTKVSALKSCRKKKMTGVPHTNIPPSPASQRRKRRSQLLWMTIAIVFGILLVTAIGVIAYALRQRFQQKDDSNINASSSSSSSFLEEGDDEPQQKLDPTTATTATTTIEDVTGGIGADVGPVSTSSPTVWITSTFTGIDSTEYTYIQPTPMPIVVDNNNVENNDDSMVLTSSSSSSADNISTTEYTVEPFVDVVDNDDDATDDSLVVVSSTATNTNATTGGTVTPPIISNSSETTATSTSTANTTTTIKPVKTTLRPVTPKNPTMKPTTTAAVPAAVVVTDSNSNSSTTVLDTDSTTNATFATDANTDVDAGTLTLTSSSSSTTTTTNTNTTTITIGEPVTNKPTTTPTTKAPVLVPTKAPTKAPTITPIVVAPTKVPTKAPVVVAPTKAPTPAGAGAGAGAAQQQQNDDDFVARLQLLLQVNQFEVDVSPESLVSDDVNPTTRAVLYMQEEFAALQEQAIQSNTQVFGNVIVTTGAYYGQRIKLNDYDDEHLLQRFALLAVYFAATTPYYNVNTEGGVNEDDDAWTTIGTPSPTESATDSPTNSDTESATDSDTDGGTNGATSGSTSSNNLRNLLVVQDDPKFLIDECDWEGVVCSRVFTPLPGGGITINNNDEYDYE